MVSDVQYAQLHYQISHGHSEGPNLDFSLIKIQLAKALIRLRSDHYIFAILIENPVFRSFSKVYLCIFPLKHLSEAIPIKITMSQKTCLMPYLRTHS